MEETCAEKSPQSGGLDAQRGGRSPCPCLFLPWGECKGPPLLCLRLLLHMLTPANSSSTFSFMLNTMGILFCNEFYPVGISDMDS